MYAKVTSFGLQGLAAFPVTAEADVAGGLPQFSIGGLPDSAVKESADRVRSAMKNSGYPFPPSRITVNLAPADVRKAGPAIPEERTPARFSARLQEPNLT